MGFDASQTILYVLETVSGPSDSSHHQSGSLYSINTASQNSVTEFDLGSTVDLPLGFAYVGGSNPSLYFSSKNGTDGRVYSIPATGGTPTVFTSGLTEPTGLAADDTYIYVYDISGSAAKIYRSPITGIQSGNLEEIPVSMIAASPASQPLALSSQDDFHTLFYVDGLQVRALDLKELTVGTIAASSSLIVNTGKLQDISSVSFSSSDSVLMVSSLAEKKVLYARAGSS
ncbi:hypothetical protein HOF92_10335 [bacterium]|nr:hypothetical protein [bacterium]